MPVAPALDTIRDGRKRRGAKKRALVLARAMHIASTHGFEGLTIGRLAADLGISKGNIAVLFPGKERLQLDTLDAAVTRFVANVVARALTAPTPLARLVALCDGWFRFVNRRELPGGCLLYATSNEYRARPGAMRDRAKHHWKAWYTVLATNIRAAQREGQLRADVPVSQLAFELMAHQAGANVAALLGERRLFQVARNATRDSIAAACPTGGTSQIRATRGAARR